MKYGVIGTAVLVLAVLGDLAWAYDYGQGVDAPHPNSKYWQITRQHPPRSSAPQRNHSTSLLRQENMLLREQVHLLKKQLQLLTRHGQCASPSSQDQLREELTMLRRVLNTLTGTLSTLRRAQRTLEGF